MLALKSNVPKVVSFATTPRTRLTLPKASFGKHAIAKGASHPDSAHQPSIGRTPLVRPEGLKGESP
eukprot:4149345-Alexandrium_andersonii.AAC.1